MDWEKIRKIVDRLWFNGTKQYDTPDDAFDELQKVILAGLHQQMQAQAGPDGPGLYPPPPPRY